VAYLIEKEERDDRVADDQPGRPEILIAVHNHGTSGIQPASSTPTIQRVPLLIVDDVPTSRVTRKPPTSVGIGLG
jgi:hypothetical protein